MASKRACWVHFREMGVSRQLDRALGREEKGGQSGGISRASPSTVFECLTKSSVGTRYGVFGRHSYRTSRKTRYAAASSALPRSLFQTTEFHELSRHNPHRRVFIRVDKRVFPMSRSDVWVQRQFGKAIFFSTAWNRGSERTKSYAGSTLSRAIPLQCSR